MARKNVEHTRREMAQISRKKILRSAERTFAKNGYEAATVADITANAGLSVGLFYHHFESKDDVYNAIVDDRLVGLLELFEKRIARSADPREKLNGMIRASVEFFEKRRQFFRMRHSISLAMWMMDDGAIGGNAAKRLKTIENLSNDVMREAVAAGVLIALAPNTLRLICRSIIVTMFQDWVDRNDRSSPEEKARTIRRIFFEGVGK